MPDALKLRCNLDDLRSKRAPLYRRYSGESSAQSAHIAISCERATISVGYNPAYGGASEPESVCFGRTRWYEVPANIGGATLADLLESSAFRALAERVYQGIEIAWDGRDFVGRADTDATAAEDGIEEMILELLAAST